MYILTSLRVLVAVFDTLVARFRAQLTLPSKHVLLNVDKQTGTDTAAMQRVNDIFLFLTLTFDVCGLRPANATDYIDVLKSFFIFYQFPR